MPYDNDNMNLEVEYLKAHVRRNIATEWNHVVQCAHVLSEGSEDTDVEENLLSALAKFITLRLPDNVKGNPDELRKSLANQQGNDHEVLKAVKESRTQFIYTAADFLREALKQDASAGSEKPSDDGPASDESMSDTGEEHDVLNEPDTDMISGDNHTPLLSRVLNWAAGLKEVSLNAVATIDSLMGNQLQPALLKAVEEIGGSTLEGNPAAAESPETAPPTGAPTSTAGKYTKYSGAGAGTGAAPAMGGGMGGMGGMGDMGGMMGMM